MVLSFFRLRNGGYLRIFSLGDVKLWARTSLAKHGDFSAHKTQQRSRTQHHSRTSNQAQNAVIRAVSSQFHHHHSTRERLWWWWQEKKLNNQQRTWLGSNENAKIERELPFICARPPPLIIIAFFLQQSTHWHCGSSCFARLFQPKETALYSTTNKL